MVLIEKGVNRQISKNFNSSEFQTTYNKGYKDIPDAYYLSGDTLATLQAIRDHYGVAMIINSSARSKSHNENEKGASRSWHLPRYQDNSLISDGSSVPPSVYATDFKFQGQNIKGSKGYNAQKDLQARLNTADGFPNDPFLIGINGIGIYHGFFHIDSRPTGRVRFGSLYKKKTLVGNVVENYIGDGDDGVEAIKPQAKKWLPVIIAVAVIVALVVGYLLYKKIKK